MQEVMAIDYFTIHKRRQSIAKNTGVCTQLRHAINVDAHEAIMKGYKADYVRTVYGIDFAAYSRLKRALNSDKLLTNLNQLTHDTKR